MRNRLRGLYSGANPTGRTSAGSPFQMPRRLASFSAARKATSSFAMVWSVTCRPARAGLRAFPFSSNTGSRGGTDHSLGRCVMAIDVGCREPRQLEVLAEDAQPVAGFSR